MSDVSWIGRASGEDSGGDAHDGLAYMSSIVDDTPGVLIVRVTPDNLYHFRVFGDLTVADVSLIGAMLVKRATQHVDGESMPGDGE